MKIRAKNPGAIASVADIWFVCALGRTRSGGGRIGLVALGDNTFGDNATQF